MAFKYENLSTFYFYCGRLGHEVIDCGEHKHGNWVNIKDDWPYSIALKVESTLMGKEWMKFGAASRKSMP